MTNARTYSSLLLAVSMALVISCKKKDKQTDKQAGKQPAPAASDAAATPAPTPTPPAKNVVGEQVTYKDGDTEMKGYIAYDKSIQGKRPGVLVVHEWWGHNEYARGRARQLAEMGYTALAVDMYGGGKQASHPKDAQKFSQEVMGNMKLAQARFEAARKLLAEHPTTDPDEISAIGYCFGGGIVLEMARRGSDLDGVASFHGMLGTKQPAKEGEVKAKLLVLHGAADPFVKPEQVEAFKKEMKAAGVDMEFVAYDNAKHAFTDPEATEKGKKFKLPLEYNEEADKKSWAALEKFLAALYPKAGDTAKPGGDTKPGGDQPGAGQPKD